MKKTHVLVENESKELQTFDSSLFIGQSYFNNGGEKLFYTPTVILCFKKSSDTEKVASCKSKALPFKRLTTPTTTDNRLSPSIKS